jgi:hypothetical protein
MCAALGFVKLLIFWRQKAVRFEKQIIPRKFVKINNNI